ncbi:hypothetical protein NA57DRAFT_80105 [Rhizodiscina lignyota]|uniref:Uncharacterized protein n=1 Tax=Rhizodiscina lignyota TaxID=1504668 RepID=A0A9P4I7L1_9PEZI|nr:hypothetical protein NA57DRAFT_80105 [Rhizodiscina lignyota]
MRFYAVAVFGIAVLFSSVLALPAELSKKAVSAESMETIKASIEAIQDEDYDWARGETD